MRQSHYGTLGQLGGSGRKPRKVPPPTVKGRDIELWPEDGQRFTSGPPPEPPPRTLVETAQGLDKPVSWFIEQIKRRVRK